MNFAVELFCETPGNQRWRLTQSKIRPPTDRLTRIGLFHRPSDYPSKNDFINGLSLRSENVTSQESDQLCTWECQSEFPLGADGEKGPVSRPLARCGAIVDHGIGNKRIIAGGSADPDKSLADQWRILR
jgi:hypothetical protein